MIYERICDVPRGMTVMIQHRVRGCHRDTGKFRVFQFELLSGAHPKYWDGWAKTEYRYYERLPMEHSFRVVEQVN